jgi:hypothetical protein
MLAELTTTTGCNFGSQLTLYAQRSRSRFSRDQRALALAGHGLVQWLFSAPTALDLREPPGAGVFPIHNFARTRQLWRRVPGGLVDGEQGTTDWFFPVALFEELVLWEGTSASICDGPTGLEDNYAPGIEGFIEAIVDVVAESRTLANPLRDFQILKPWRLPLPCTLEQELARLDRFWERPRACESP